jgi:phosphoglycolate phosphatase
MSILALAIPFPTRYDGPVSVPGRSGDVASRPFIVACDWNGTLVDDGDRAWQATDAVLGRLGLQAPRRADFFARWRLPLGSLFEELGVPGSELDGAVRDWNQEVGAREATLARGVLEMVEGIRSMGGGVGIVSAADVRVIERDVARLGLTGILDFVVGGAEPKQAALRAIRPDRPAQVVYVGDTEYDVIEARAAGVWAIGYGGGYRPSSALAAAGADHVIERLDVRPALVRRLDGLAPPRTDASR